MPIALQAGVPAARPVRGGVEEIWFENPRVGRRSRILTLPRETGGRTFVVEYVNRPFGGKNAVPMPHTRRRSRF